MSARQRVLKRAGVTSPNGTHPPSPAGPLDTGISLRELLATDLPEPEFLVGGLLPQGLSLLAARPKTGKSWLALQLAVAVALGRTCLGGSKTRQAPVLFLALEDTRRRVKSRAGQLIAALGWHASDELTVRVSWPRAGHGGLAELGEWFADHPGGLAVVDTLGRFRDPAKGRGTSYQEDYDAISGLKTVADAHGGGALVIHHTRKGVAEDPFDEVSGTLGINGAADSLLVLERERGAATGTLYLTGRDLADETLTLGWADTGVWTLTGREDGVSRPEKAAPTNQVDRCAAWLVTFLGDRAWPDVEVEAAAADAGFTLDNLKRAKAKQRKETPALCSRPQGQGGAWWNWIGDKGSRPYDRNTPYVSNARTPNETPQSPHTQQSRESPHTGRQPPPVSGISGVCGG